MLVLYEMIPYIDINVTFNAHEVSTGGSRDQGLFVLGCIININVIRKVQLYVAARHGFLLFWCSITHNDLSNESL